MGYILLCQDVLLEALVLKEYNGTAYGDVDYF